MSTVHIRVGDELVWHRHAANPIMEGKRIVTYINDADNITYTWWRTSLSGPLAIPTSLARVRHLITRGFLSVAPRWASDFDLPEGL